MICSINTRVVLIVSKRMQGLGRHSPVQDLHRHTPTADQRLPDAVGNTGDDSDDGGVLAEDGMARNEISRPQIPAVAGTMAGSQVRAGISFTGTCILFRMSRSGASLCMVSPG